VREGVARSVLGHCSGETARVSQRCSEVDLHVWKGAVPCEKVLSIGVLKELCCLEEHAEKLYAWSVDWRLQTHQGADRIAAPAARSS
jgi:hypothetical protein